MYGNWENGKRDLIKNGSPIGKELEINGSNFKVIGVFLTTVETGTKE